MSIVADTGPLLAAANRNDESHELAAALVTAAGRDLLVPDPVAVEVDWLLRERVGSASARAFLDSLVNGEHERVPLTTSLFRRAAEIDLRHADLGLGLVDASVVAIAEARRSPIMTFDFRDFRAVTTATGRALRLVVQESDYTRWRRRPR